MKCAVYLQSNTNRRDQSNNYWINQQFNQFTQQYKNTENNYQSSKLKKEMHDGQLAAELSHRQNCWFCWFCSSPAISPTLSPVSNPLTNESESPILSPNKLHLRPPNRHRKSPSEEEKRKIHPILKHSPTTSTASILEPDDDCDELELRFQHRQRTYRSSRRSTANKSQEIIVDDQKEKEDRSLFEPVPESSSRLAARRSYGHTNPIQPIFVHPPSSPSHQQLLSPLSSSSTSTLSQSPMSSSSAMSHPLSRHLFTHSASAGVSASNSTATSRSHSPEQSRRGSLLHLRQKSQTKYTLDTSELIVVEDLNGSDSEHEDIADTIRRHSHEKKEQHHRNTSVGRLRVAIDELPSAATPNRRTLLPLSMSSPNSVATSPIPPSRMLSPMATTAVHLSYHHSPSAPAHPPSLHHSPHPPPSCGSLSPLLPQSPRTPSRPGTPIGGRDHFRRKTWSRRPSLEPVDMLNVLVEKENDL